MNFYIWRFFLTIQHFFFSVFKVSKKALCFRNKKKTDDINDDVPLNIVVIDNNKPQQQNYLPPQQTYSNAPQQNYPNQQQFAPQTYQTPVEDPQDYNEDEQNNFEEWGSWDNNQQKDQKQEEEEEVVEEEVDYFADMEPVVKIKKVRQCKIFY